jgi:hypothetical protein
MSKGQEVNRTFDEAVNLKEILNKLEKESNLIPAPRPVPTMPLPPKFGNEGKLPPVLHVYRVLDDSRFYGWATVPIGPESFQFRVEAVFVLPIGETTGRESTVSVINIQSWKVIGTWKPPNGPRWVPVMKPVPPSKLTLEYNTKQEKLNSTRATYEKARASLPPKDRQKLDDYSPGSKEAKLMLESIYPLLQSDPSLARLRLQELLSKYPGTTYAKEALSILNKRLK